MFQLGLAGMQPCQFGFCLRHLPLQWLQLFALFRLQTFFVLSGHGIGCRLVFPRRYPSLTVVISQPFGIVIQTARKLIHPAIMHPYQPVAGDTQQVAVMGHQHHGAAEVLQRQRQRLPHFEVQVIGGFIQQQQIGALIDE